MVSKIFFPPIKVFLIDALGALVTAFLVGIILPHFQEHIGMPKEILISLSLIAVVFCIYSFCCFFMLKRNWEPFLKGIAVANLLYCIATTVLLITVYHQLTFFGFLYFIGEIIVIGILVYFEFLVLKRTENSKL